MPTRKKPTLNSIARQWEDLLPFWSWERYHTMDGFVWRAFANPPIYKDGEMQSDIHVFEDDIQKHGKSLSGHQVIVSAFAELFRLAKAVECGKKTA